MPNLDIRRIVISASSFSEAKAALRIVEQLADSLTSDITGLLYEEPDLPRLIALPGQRFVTDSGHIIDPPSPVRLKAILKSDMSRFRQELSRLADLRQARWSVRHLRAEQVTGSCEAAAVGDVLIFGCRVRPVRRDRVALLCAPSGTDGAAARFAGELARQLGADLVRWTGGDSDAVLDWVRRIDPDAVVVDLEAGPLQAPDQLRTLVSGANCPVVVLGAGGTDA